MKLIIFFAVSLAAIAPQSCDLTFDDSLVSCDGDEVIVKVPTCAITEAGFDVTSVYMGAEGCAGEEEGEYLKFTSDEGDCEIDQVVTETHITYQSTIAGTGGAGQNSVITRSFELELKFSCSLTRGMELTIEHGIEVNIHHFIVDLGEEAGSFDVDIAVYASDDMESVIRVDHKFNIPDVVYIGIHLADAGNFVVSLDTCTAYKSTDTLKTTGYDLIKDGCAKDANIISSGESADAAWSFLSFQFVGSEDPIVIQCDINICDLDEGNCATCGTVAPPNLRRRRSSQEGHVTSVSTTIGVVFDDDN